MPRLQGHIIMPGSFLDDGDDVHAVNYDHNDDEMEQAFTFNTFSPLSTPPPQSYPIMPGSFLDDEDDIYADKDEPIQPNGLQEANESFGTGGAVSSPSTPSPTNGNNEHRRPSSKRKRPGRGHSQVKWQFIPHNRSGNDILHTVVISQLTPSELSAGYIYILHRPEDPEYLKIGYTTQDPDARLEEWCRSCRSSYIRLYATESIPNVKRVESLLHADLRPVRYKESRCKHNPDCKVQHTKWFKVSFERARAAVEHWAQWMTALEPYESESGLLKAKNVLQMFRDDDGVFSDANDMANLFLTDSDGNSWVEHSQVLALSKKDTPPVSPPEQRAAPLPNRSASNREPPQLPSTPIPPYIIPGTRTSSASTTASVFSEVSTTSSASDVTATVVGISSDQVSSKPTRRRLFPNAPKPTTSPIHSSPAYSAEMDMDVTAAGRQTPSKASPHGKKKIPSGITPSKPGRAISAPELPNPITPTPPPSRGNHRLVSVATATTSNGRTPMFRRASTNDATGTTSAAPSPAPIQATPHLDRLTVKARELATGGHLPHRAVSSPAVLAQQLQQRERNVIDEAAQAKTVSDKQLRDVMAADRCGGGESAGDHASGQGAEESDSSEHDEDHNDDSETDDSDADAEEWETESQSNNGSDSESGGEANSLDSHMASDLNSGADEGYASENDSTN